ncbi:MAG TPA: nucleotidyl transferase AbiEii/AbiGii toxin family protein [Cyclobacteriaceae bacterium]|nr:nucleotidyl transferase AbiEii/AbiGii toxin family protein [Cyclobacteriaceae bacterium]
MNHQNNIYRIKTVYDSLNDLKDDVVFVGGATVSFYADQQAFEIRETDDVDVIVEVLNFRAHTDFEERLRMIGFVNDVMSKVRCRYKIKGITVDIMPTKNIAIGFENRWYPDGFKHAMDFQLDETTTIKVLTPAHFIATKLEAFKSRGASDPRQSQDFEDIVYILENRKSIWKEMRMANQTLRDYLKVEFNALSANPNIYEWIDCHVEFVSPPSTDWILEEIRDFVSKDQG